MRLNNTWKLIKKYTLIVAIIIFLWIALALCSCNYRINKACNINLQGNNKGVSACVTCDSSALNILLNTLHINK